MNLKNIKLFSFFTFITFLLSGCADMKFTDFNFKTFKRNDKPNSYLVCPNDYCHTQVDRISPVYPVSVTTLESAWKKMISNQPRTTLVGHNDDTYQYIQRSLIFRFPDYINIKFIPLGSDKSTLAIYSHSVYGYSDMGVNKKRIENWLVQLQQFLAQ